MDHSPAISGEHASVEQLRHGDGAVWHTLVERYHAPLVRLAMRWAGDPAAAEDIAQETWLALIEGLDRFAERDSLRTWLFRILVNCARANRRANSRAVTFSRLPIDTEYDGSKVMDRPFGRETSSTCSAEVELRLETWVLAGRISEAIERLPPRQRAISPSGTSRGGRPARSAACSVSPPRTSACCYIGRARMSAGRWARRP